MPQSEREKKNEILTCGIYLRTDSNPVATEAFKVGETGVSPKNTSKSAELTFSDSIVASTLDGSPLDEMET